MRRGELSRMSLFTADTPKDTPVAWIFVAIQGVLLVGIALLPAGHAWVAPAWLATAAYVSQLIGIVVLVVGLVNLGRSLTPLPTPVPHGVLHTGGLYRYVRHPIYSGILALCIGLTIRAASWPTLWCTVGLVVLFTTKARWEETRLRHRYPGYDAYAARTPRFVPLWPWR